MSTVARVARPDEAWAPDWDALRPRGLYPRYGRRLLELVLLAVTLPLAVPPALFVLACNVVVFRSLRRAFFLQERVGERGRVFRIVKFRTMRDGAPRTGGPSPEDDEARVTGLGRLLRSTHLDELPQFVNILRGEMTFIGPRPEMVEIEDWACTHVPGFQNRLVLRPGITGFAQITQGYTVRDVAAYRRKLEINDIYRRNVRLSVDLEILVRTAIWMIRGRGWSWNDQAAVLEAHGSLRSPALRRESLLADGSGERFPAPVEGVAVQVPAVDERAA